ncbi:MAG: hypothetical protein WKF96_01290 [Solirubrobacteraceae bacterium]
MESPCCDAVERDLAALAERDEELASSALAATAVALAKEIDKPRNSATSKSMCARALADTLRELRELAPAKKEDDAIDKLSAGRVLRLAGGSDS